MDYNQFVRKVQEYSGLKNPDAAARVIHATLETLGERLPSTHREHLASQLPSELKSDLPKRQRMVYLLLEEFYRRVANRADLSYNNFVKYARAVASVLREAIAPGEMEDIFSGFPEDYNELFLKPSAGVAE
jgi:uncharacterized protein (DUF2267 family)